MLQLDKMNLHNNLNRRVWDAMARDRHPFTRPACDADFSNPLSAIDIAGWTGAVTGKRVLCLAGGGGRQGPLFSAAGAQVTVLDLSPEMLALDRQVASERGLELRTVEGSMEDLSMFESGSFDLVYQPVSTCYVQSLLPVYREVARVTASEGTYISQHKQPTSLQTSLETNAAGDFELVEEYYLNGPLRPVSKSILRESGAQEFVHRWEELVGGICRGGFVIEDLIEPFHADADTARGSFAHRARYVAPYVRIKARRRGMPAASKQIILP